MLGAIIGGVVGLGSAILGGKSAKKAANTAADAQQQVATQNNALTREFYQNNAETLNPYIQSGNRANALLDSFIYGPQSPQSPTSAQTTPTGYGYPNPDNGGFGGELGPRQGMGQRFQATQGQMMPQAFAQPGAVTQGNPTGQNAFDTFRNSTNYQFRLGEGLNALNQGYAARGMLQSGAAMKGINNYAQQQASNELNNYLGLVQGQRNTGLTGASALAGVGQNALTMQTGNNQNAADAASNAALLRAQANNSMYGGIANALGGLASSFKW